MSIGSFFSRGATGAKPPAGEAPGHGVQHSVKPQSAGPGNKPGADAPEHLQDSQPEGKPSKWGDRLQTASNVGMMGSMVYPMIQEHNQKKDAEKPGQGEPKIQDKELYNQMKVQTSVGSTPVNW